MRMKLVCSSRALALREVGAGRLIPIATDRGRVGEQVRAAAMACSSPPAAGPRCAGDSGRLPGEDVRALRQPSGSRDATGQRRRVSVT
jgi:hypothetical protein